jgi:hypothetical protein
MNSCAYGCNPEPYICFGKLAPYEIVFSDEKLLNLVETFKHLDNGFFVGLLAGREPSPVNAVCS